MLNTTQYLVQSSFLTLQVLRKYYVMISVMLNKIFCFAVDRQLPLQAIRYLINCYKVSLYLLQIWKNIHNFLLYGAFIMRFT